MIRLLKGFGKPQKRPDPTILYRSYRNGLLDITVEVFVIPKGPLMQAYFGTILFTGDVLSILSRFMLPWPDITSISRALLQYALFSIIRTFNLQLNPFLLPPASAVGRFIGTFLFAFMSWMWLLLTGILTWCWFKQPTKFNDLVEVVVRRQSGEVERLYWSKRSQLKASHGEGSTSTDTEEESVDELDGIDWGDEDWFGDPGREAARFTDSMFG
ncbi:hypothetical protein TWF718_002654 [Orbilia javanica]|uniref:Uncharacterized protein n=1 Tax=Orbilia javanica TaxID=47235 RepID=A0AAN8MG81_9PEZI